MKFGVCILLLVLTAVPAVAQEPEADALRDLGVGGEWALGDLALADLQKATDPVQQMKRFFLAANLPLTALQEKQLKGNVDIVYKNLQTAHSDAEVRQANLQFNKQLFVILTAAQGTALKRYRNQQIMMRGGFPALRLMLENAKTPLTAEQEKQAQSLYQEFSQQAEQLTREAQGAPNKAILDKLENDALGKVVKLLTPAQRQALAASRLGALNSSSKPPQ